MENYKEVLADERGFDSYTDLLATVMQLLADQTGEYVTLNHSQLAIFVGHSDMEPVSPEVLRENIDMLLSQK